MNGGKLTKFNKALFSMNCNLGVLIESIIKLNLQTLAINHSIDALVIKY